MAELNDYPVMLCKHTHDLQNEKFVQNYGKLNVNKYQTTAEVTITHAQACYGNYIKVRDTNVTQYD